MLKRTYALGLLAAATLGCFLTPAAQASQVEVNKQTAAQNAAAVGHNAVFQDLNQGSYQNQLDYPSSGYYHPSLNTQVQISDQDAKQNGAAVGTGNAVLTKTQHSEAIRLLITKVTNDFTRFVGFLA